MPRLPSKVALITGAARGVGKAVAAAFVREGAGVVATDLNTELGSLAAADVGASFAGLDVRDDSAWRRVVDAALSEHGRLDVAALAVYLASDESKYTTGASFNLDGGTLAGSASPRVGPKGG